MLAWVNLERMNNGNNAKQQDMVRKLALIAGLLSLMGSCAGSDEPAIDNSPEAKEYKMEFAGRVGFDGESRAVYYTWPDGSVLYIKVPGGAMAGEYVWATFKKDGWILENYNGAETDEVACEVLYIEGAKKDDYASTSYKYNAFHPAYYTSAGKFKFVNGNAMLQADLQPLTGRIRYVVESKPSNVATNFAQYQLNADRNGVESLGYSTTELAFAQCEDGKWYSPYIYTSDVPHLKIEQMVYKYQAKEVIESGKSAAVAVPGTSSDGWISEEYQVNTCYDKTISSSYDHNYYLPNLTSEITYFSSQIGCVRRIKLHVSENSDLELAFVIDSFLSSFLWDDISRVGNYEVEHYTTESMTSAYINANHAAWWGYSSYTIHIESYLESNF